MRQAKKHNFRDANFVDDDMWRASDDEFPSSGLDPDAPTNGISPRRSMESRMRVAMRRAPWGDLSNVKS